MIVVPNSILTAQEQRLLRFARFACGAANSMELVIDAISFLEKFSLHYTSDRDVSLHRQKFSGRKICLGWVLFLEGSFVRARCDSRYSAWNMNR